MIRYSTEQIKQYYSIGAIVIDQIADLMPNYDVNDSEAAGELIEYLQGLMNTNDCMIMLAMHTNRGGKLSNGILGKNLDHKVYSSFLVEYEQEDNITTVTHTKSRRRKMSKIRFMQDFSGKPRLLNYNNNNF